MELHEAIATFRQDRANLEQYGVTWHDGAPVPLGYWPEGNKQMALDAVASVPAIILDPSSSIPTMLTTFIDPTVYEVLFAPNAIAEIMGEERKGTWVEQTLMLPVAEATGETSSYGDYNNNGRAGVVTNFPQVQSYLFQVIKQYGELEMARMGLARLNWVSEIDRAAAITLNKYSNFTYAYGVLGLQNYGLLNNPYLTPALTPGAKAAGGTAWISPQGVVVATANEVFTDIQSMYYQLVSQNPGLVSPDTEMTLAMGPTSTVALTATNSFNVNVSDLLTKNFKKITVKEAVQYQARTASNPQGQSAGNMVQLIVNELEGQKTGYCAYNEKMRSFPIVRQLSSFQQKMLAGTWGTVIRYPAGIVNMVGV